MPVRETVLVTIRLSPFCEKARWALQYTGTPFRESAHAPGFHVPATRRAGGRTTPVLVTEGGVFSDSTDILKELDRAASDAHRLYPVDEAERREVLALEEDFDEALGPHLRRVMYHHLLGDKSLALQLFREGVPRFERVMLPVVFPLLRKRMRSSMSIHASGAERSRVVVERVLRDVSERLADGRRYLVGERFSAADLTFAALAARLVGVRNYGGGMPTDESLPSELMSLFAGWRQTAAAEHVRRMYAWHRDPPAPPAG